MSVYVYVGCYSVLEIDELLLHDEGLKQHICICDAYLMHSTIITNNKSSSCHTLLHMIRARFEQNVFMYRLRACMTYLKKYLMIIMDVMELFTFLIIWCV